MPKYTMTTNSVICIDDQYIETDQISYISSIGISGLSSGDKVADKKLPHSFHVMLVGHSNVLHFEAKDWFGTFAKRNFILEGWTSSEASGVPTFDMTSEKLKIINEVEDFTEGMTEEQINDLMDNDDEEEGDEREN